MTVLTSEQLANELRALVERDGSSITGEGEFYQGLRSLAEQLSAASVPPSALVTTYEELGADCPREFVGQYLSLGFALCARLLEKGQTRLVLAMMERLLTIAEGGESRLIRRLREVVNNLVELEKTRAVDRREGRAYLAHLEKRALELKEIISQDRSEPGESITQSAVKLPSPAGGDTWSLGEANSIESSIAEVVPYVETKRSSGMGKGKLMLVLISVILILGVLIYYSLAEFAGSFAGRSSESGSVFVLYPETASILPEPAHELPESPAPSPLSKLEERIKSAENDVIQKGEPPKRVEPFDASKPDPNYKPPTNQPRDIKVENLGTESRVQSVSKDSAPSSTAPKAPSMPPPPPGLRVVFYSVAQATAVYTEPSAKSLPVARLSVGAQVQVVRKLGEWAEVRSTGGRAGFVPVRDLKVVE